MAERMFDFQMGQQWRCFIRNKEPSQRPHSPNNMVIDFIKFLTKITYKIDYITIPLSFRYYMIEGFNLEAGPQFAFFIIRK